MDRSQAEAINSVFKYFSILTPKQFIDNFNL